MEVMNAIISKYIRSNYDIKTQMYGDVLYVFCKHGWVCDIHNDRIINHGETIITSMFHPDYLKMIDIAINNRELYSGDRYPLTSF